MPIRVTARDPAHLPVARVPSITVIAATPDPSKARKPFNGVPGYQASLRSGAGAGYVVIYEARPRGLALTTRYGVVCETHAQGTGASSMPAARTLMKEPATFCPRCAAVLG